jgi:hypothetical protein
MESHSNLGSPARDLDTPRQHAHTAASAQPERLFQRSDAQISGVTHLPGTLSRMCPERLSPVPQSNQNLPIPIMRLWSEG